MILMLFRLWFLVVVLLVVPSTKNGNGKKITALLHGLRTRHSTNRGQGELVLNVEEGIIVIFTKFTANIDNVEDGRVVLLGPSDSGKRIR